MANYKELTASITGVTTPLAVNITQSHDAACAIANIVCKDTTLDIGSAITASLGYGGVNTKAFEGYVKSVEKKTPQGVYTITAHDTLTRAVDFFIVSPTPASGYKFKNITAHALIQQLMEMAGLHSFDFDNTFFTLGINNEFEVNLVSAYDYSRMISDLIAWTVWSDKDGVVHLKNRKPYPMFGTSGQPGDVADVSVATFTDDDIFEVTYAFNEKDLRNKVCIYGAEDLYKEASSATSYDPATGGYRVILPAGFYKAMVLASPLIDSATFAQNAVNYNLQLFNRVYYQCPFSIEGDASIQARDLITINSTKSSISKNFYVFQCEQNWSSGGYVTNLLLTL